MTTKKKKPLSKTKQKQPEIREISPVDGHGCLWMKRFLAKICTCTHHNFCQTYLLTTPVEPVDFHTCPSVTVFRTKLKSLLYREAFNC